MRFQEHVLNEYRRHAPNCKLTKPSDMNCVCLIWALGRVKGKRLRRSLGTRSRQRAREIIKTLLDERAEARRDETTIEGLTLSQALGCAAAGVLVIFRLVPRTVRPLDATSIASRCQGVIFVTAGCLLAFLPCHRPSPLAIERNTFHRQPVATTVDPPPLNFSLRSNYKGVGAAAAGRVRVLSR
jgi:hypothetical protein